MKKSATIKVSVGRFGYPVITIELATGSTFEDLMDKASADFGWAGLSSAEKAYVNNVPLDNEDEMENGDNVQIIARKEGGNK